MSNEKYEFLELLGEGAYGKVYKARDRETQKLVAIKKSKSKDDDMATAELREVGVLRMLEIQGKAHPNVIQLVEVQSVNRCVRIVLELLDKNLATHLKELSAEKSQDLARQLLCGVEHCHSRGIVHRDLKPCNLLLDEAGTLKIADFGMAREVSIPLRPLTPEHCTLWYRAPEVLVGEKLYSFPVDIWACGCIIAEMHNGQALFRGMSEIEQLGEIVDVLGMPPPGTYAKGIITTNLRPEVKTLAAVVPTISADGLDLLSHILCFAPAKRISARQALSHPYLAFFEK